MSGEDQAEEIFTGDRRSGYTISLSKETKELFALYKGYQRFDSEIDVTDPVGGDLPYPTLNEHFANAAALSHFFWWDSPTAIGKNRMSASRILTLASVHADVETRSKFLNRRLKCRENLIEALQDDIERNIEIAKEEYELRKEEDPNAGKNLTFLIDKIKKAGSRSVKTPIRVMTAEGVVNLTTDNLEEVAAETTPIASIQASQSLRFDTSKAPINAYLEYVQIGVEKEEEHNNDIQIRIDRLEAELEKLPILSADYKAISDKISLLAAFMRYKWHKAKDMLLAWREHMPPVLFAQLAAGEITSTAYNYSIVYNLDGKTARGAQKTKRFQVTVPSVLYVNYDQWIELNVPKYLRTKIGNQQMYSVAKGSASTPQVALLPLDVIMENWETMLFNRIFDLGMIVEIVRTHTKDKNISVKLPLVTEAAKRHREAELEAEYEAMKQSNTEKEQSS